MKYLPFIFLILYIGCTDNPVNPTNGNPPLSGDSLMVSIDSIGISISQIINNPRGETFDIVLDTSIVKKLKFTFTLETNFDSISGLQGVRGRDSFINLNGYTACNKSYTIFYVPPHNNIWVDIDIYRTFNPAYKYIFAKNVKVYRVF